jgi:4-hydroxybenzoate polyprenyltransferase
MAHLSRPPPGWGARARGYLALLHPFPVALILLAMLAFAFVAARGHPAPTALAWLLASALACQTAIASLNDYCDQALDARTKPTKPLPAGLVSPRAALAIALATVPLTLLCALPLGPVALAAATTHLAGGLAYDLWLKGTVGSFLPFVVAFPALPIWAWAAVAPLDPRLWEAYPLGAPLVIGLHLADTWPDLEADRAQGVRGLAHRLGPRGTAVLLAACFSAAVLLLAGLALLPGRPTGLLLCAAAIALGCLAVAAVVNRRGPTRWPVTFALLALAAGTVGTGWLASLVV